MCNGNSRCSSTRVVFAMVLALVVAACGSPQRPEAPAPSPRSPQAEVTVPAGGSVLDGIFTARQASRGEATFRQVCAACHNISEFRGGRFRLVWVGRTVGDLFETMSTLMPEEDPGSLSPEEYSAIISYMLRENGYPAGEENLAGDASTLQDIRIVVGAP